MSLSFIFIGIALKLNLIGLVSMGKVTRYFELDFYGGNCDEFLKEILGEIGKGKKKLVICTPNSDFIYRASIDQYFKSLLQKSDYLVADGFPISLLSFIVSCLGLGRSAVWRITGASVTDRLSRLAASQGYSVLFFGGDDGVSRKAAQIISSEVGGEVNWIFPAYGFTEDVAASDKYIEEINRYSPDFLFIGLGSPKQEFWIMENKFKLNFGAAFGVGASFDFIAGAQYRAPKLVQYLGAEWLFRIMQEPRRLSRRYATLFFPFLKLFVKEIFLNDKRKA